MLISYESLYNLFAAHRSFVSLIPNPNIATYQPINASTLQVQTVLRAVVVGYALVLMLSFLPIPTVLKAFAFFRLGLASSLRCVLAAS